MSNDEALKRICRGTTSRPDKLKVLYNNGTILLVKFPTAYVSNHAFSKEYYSPYVQMYSTVDPKIKLGVMFGKSVWDCARNKQGPLTRKRLLGLVKSLGLDPSGIQEAGSA